MINDAAIINSQSMNVCRFRSSCHTREFNRMGSLSPCSPKTPCPMLLTFPLITAHTWETLNCACVESHIWWSYQSRLYRIGLLRRLSTSRASRATARYSLIQFGSDSGRGKKCPAVGIIFIETLLCNNLGGCEHCVRERIIRPGDCQDCAIQWRTKSPTFVFGYDSSVFQSERMSIQIGVI